MHPVSEQCKQKANKTGVCFSLVFLSSELQAAIIVSGGRGCDNHQAESLGQQELSAICKTLKLLEPAGKGAAEVFSQLQNKVRPVRWLI